jgi:valyl-tRNA synthetase
MMDKTYEPKTIEPAVSAAWEAAGAFRVDRADRAGADAYTIVIPPPNVTGSLHIGHALNNTLQDILCRFERMRGKAVLWQPGTDHAGIATQMVVERNLAKEGNEDRRTMGREKFLDKVWDWKAFSEGTITDQLRRLGASCDFSRERFTLGRRPAVGANQQSDESDQMVRAVTEFFVRLHEAGLLYKDKRLVNWDPKFQTAISDLEVVQKEIRGGFAWDRASGEPFAAEKLGKMLDREPGGHLYHLDYPVVDDEGRETGAFVTVATTRPETMLGDTAVAVNPEDERYRHLVGRMVRLPIVGRLIPVVADEYSDPEKGTGAVKITPAHDFNDFEVGRRHGLPMVNIFTAEAALTEEMPQSLAGLPRFEARKRVVSLLEGSGRLARIEPTVQQAPHGDRSDVPIEPYLTEQWYVDVKPLAERAMAAVREGRTRFVPEMYEKTFFNWLQNIEPWCVSRQLWWGHQIPAWSFGDGEIVVARSEAEAQTIADGKAGHSVNLTRDPDVLDTWFSSALWPFSTLGWPDGGGESEALQARHYPNSTLVTGFDIIFFWVARMMMAGLFLKDDVPFRTVYIHGLVRDERGQKMSKSRGNVVDPLTMVEKFGADALRFALAANASQGRDLKFGEKLVEGYRNFATKLWNAARFAEMNGVERVAGFDPRSPRLPLNRWILAETEAAAAEVTAAIEAFRFNDAAGGVYRFIWNQICDRYVELAKPILAGEDEGEKAETRATLAFVLDQAEALLHPFMPFITEALRKGRGGEGLVALSPWPALEGLADPDAEAEIGWLIEAIGEIRSARSEVNVPAGAEGALVLLSPSPETRARAARHAAALKRLARVSEIRVADAPPREALRIVVRGEAAALPLAGLIDIAAERARLTKETAALEADIAKVAQKLADPQFVERAPEEVIEEQKARRAAALQRAERIAEALKALG